MPTDTLGSWPYTLNGFVDRENGIVGAPEFAPTTRVAGAPDHVWIGTGRDDEVTGVRASDGRTRLVRWTGPDRRVSPDAVLLLLEEYLAFAPNPEAEAGIRRWFANAPIADRFPAYAEILGGTDGSLYVKEYERPGTDRPSRWLVFDPSGRLVGRLSLPRTFRPFEWEPGHILGVFQDELGVEFIRTYRITGTAD